MIIKLYLLASMNATAVYWGCEKELNLKPAICSELGGIPNDGGNESRTGLYPAGFWDHNSNVFVSIS